MTAIAELIESTPKGLVIINTAKDTVVTGLHENYAKILFEWDTMKARLDFETNLAITSIRNSINKTSQVSANDRMIRTDLDNPKTEISNLDAAIDTVIKKETSTATNVIRGTAEESIQKTIHNIKYHYNDQI